MKNSKSDHWKKIITPPLSIENAPSVFFWCPITQYNCKVQCLKHQKFLEVETWNNIVTNKSNRNPRLIYDLFHNILFVQSNYRCNSTDESHLIKSSDMDIFDQLPTHIQAKFPFCKYNTSMFTQEFIDYIFSQVAQGNNFSQISESIATFHKDEHSRRNSAADGHIEEFQSDPMYSFLQEVTSMMYSLISLNSEKKDIIQKWLKLIQVAWSPATTRSMLRKVYSVFTFYSTSFYVYKNLW